MKRRSFLKGLGALGLMSYAPASSVQLPAASVSSVSVAASDAAVVWKTWPRPDYTYFGKPYYMHYASMEINGSLYDWASLSESPEPTPAEREVAMAAFDRVRRKA